MPDPARVLRVSCPAKVNLALSVGSPDAAGMHPIASWMVAVNLCDQLTVEALPAPPGIFDIAFEPADDAPDTVTPIVDWPLEKDLTCKAHALLQRRAGRELPIRLTLRKRIPAGAGLGGGSSNAARTLTALNQLFDLHLDQAELVALSRELGSDVAFGIASAHGTTSAVVTGLGERLEPAPRRQTIHLVLILPPFGCPTGPVYKAFDQLRGYAAAGDAGRTKAATPDDGRVRQLASLTTLPQDAPFNDLAEAACTVQPPLREIRQRLRAALNLPVHITGSGSTLFVIAPSALTAKALARKVAATTGLRAIATRTL
jgi:4-diphosphocytidyl-2-C-methyl-D-erythritol kinase